MSKAFIKLKQKPKKPKRGTIINYADLDDGATFQEVMDQLGIQNPSEVTIDEDRWEYTKVHAKSSRPQTDKEYGENLAQYEKRLHDYDVWYRENKKLIGKEVARRTEAAQERKAKAVELEEKRLRTALAKIQKQLGVKI